MLRLPDPVLIVLVGPSASGKSWWAAQHFLPTQVASSDQLRSLVGESAGDLTASDDAFTVLDLIVAARTRRRLTTVVDTLGLDSARRQHWIDLAAHHQIPCIAVAFDTPAAECRARNAARSSPAERVPQAVLAAQLRTYATHRPLLDAQGFDQVISAEPVRVVPAAFVPAAFVPPPAAAVATQPGGAGAARLRFGLQLSRFDVPGGPPRLAEQLTRVAAAAERAGFDSLWVMDHVRQIPQAGRAWEDMPESTAALGYLAGATSRATIGCLVNGITYRNVAQLGKIVATLDVLSGGRARCGLGAAWFQAEHEGYGWPFPPAAHRLDLLEDALQLLPVLWGPGSAPFQGKVLSVPETMCYPRPLQQRIPILVGGSGEKRTLRLVARYAQACNLMGGPAAVRHKLAVLRQHCADAGRDASQIEVTHLSTALVAGNQAELEQQLAQRRPARGHARWAAQQNPGTIEDHLIRVGALRDAGVQHVIVSLAGVWDSPAIERFGEVIEQVRATGPAAH